MLTLERLLDASASLLAPERVAELALPDDELHREILVPLLPAMIADKAIRAYWYTRSSSGFASQLKSFPDGCETPLRWSAADFEIHVSASYQAGADARALADTLLSEGSLRELAAGVMNAALDKIRAQASQPISAVVNETITIVCGLATDRRVRRSTVRTANAGTFIVRRLLAGHWTAQANRSL